MNAKIKKYVVPNLPYLLIFWFFCKIGEGYRAGLFAEPDMAGLSALPAAGLSENIC